MNNKIIIKPAEGTASDEATKTNEEMVKKYDSFIKNYEEQLSYFKNEYNSWHKKDICITIIAFVFLIPVFLSLLFACKGILEPFNVFVVFGGLSCGLGCVILRSLFDDITGSFHSSIKEIQHDYNVQEKGIQGCFLQDKQRRNCRM